MISPRLANLYMRRFVLGWKTLGHEQRLRAYLVNYADDFVICCCGTAAKALAAMREMMERLRLTVNETKTRVRRLPEETFDFLGYTFGRYYTFGTGQPYLAMRPSRKSIHRLCRSIREETARWGWKWFRQAFVYVAARVPRGARQVRVFLADGHRFVEHLLIAAQRLQSFVFEHSPSLQFQ